mmetsp:Transcript_94375/g.137772  ORF Transcript_94375/g.137772 Transcript_94375/m.137772 type:complete len:204 (+) Transcript_94375:246-857(+)
MGSKCCFSLVLLLHFLLLPLCEPPAFHHPQQRVAACYSVLQCVDSVLQCVVWTGLHHPQLYFLGPNPNANFGRGLSLPPFILLPKINFCCSFLAAFSATSFCRASSAFRAFSSSSASRCCRSSSSRSAFSTSGSLGGGASSSSISISPASVGSYSPGGGGGKIFCSTTGCRGHAPAPSLAAPAAGQPLGSVALATVSIALAPS